MLAVDRQLGSCGRHVPCCLFGCNNLRLNSIKHDEKLNSHLCNSGARAARPQPTNHSPLASASSSWPGGTARSRAPCAARSWFPAWDNNMQKPPKREGPGTSGGFWHVRTAICHCSSDSGVFRNAHVACCFIVWCRYSPRYQSLTCSNINMDRI